jgi:hypothetical protein
MGYNRVISKQGLVEEEVNTMAEQGVVTPVALAKELKIRPQVIFGWVRKGSIPSHKCVCDHTYLLRDEVNTFLAARKAKEEEKQAKLEAELEEKTA